VVVSLVEEGTWKEPKGESWNKFIFIVPFDKMGVHIFELDKREKKARQKKARSLWAESRRGGENLFGDVLPRV